MSVARAVCSRAASVHRPDPCLRDGLFALELLGQPLGSTVARSWKVVIPSERSCSWTTGPIPLSTVRSSGGRALTTPVSPAVCSGTRPAAVRPCRTEGSCAVRPLGSHQKTGRSSVEELAPHRRLPLRAPYSARRWICQGRRNLERASSVCNEDSGEPSGSRRFAGSRRAGRVSIYSTSGNLRPARSFSTLTFTAISCPQERPSVIHRQPADHRKALPHDQGRDSLRRMLERRIVRVRRGRAIRPSPWHPAPNRPAVGSRGLQS